MMVPGLGQGKRPKPNSRSTAAAAAPESADGNAEDSSRTGKGPSHVTNISHWSKPDYTRVAIDLERDIQFEAQRIDNPERIFFDLLDTNLVVQVDGQKLRGG